MRLRLIHAGYKLAWLMLWLTAPLHHGRGRGVKAVLTHHGAVLLVQHTYGPRRWELPGGGLRRRETPLDGVRREVREELGIDLAEPALLACGTGSGRALNRVVSVFAAELPSADVAPDPHEIARARWYRRDELPPRLGWQVAAALDALGRGGAVAPIDLRPRADGADGARASWHTHRMNHEQLVRETYDALSRGDVDVLSAVLTPDARWRAVEDGPWNCENRETILTVMVEQGIGGAGAVEDVFDVGERAVVAFRPREHDPDAWPLDDGIRYVVLSFRDGLIAEIKGCANRAVALEYAASA